MGTEIFKGSPFWQTIRIGLFVLRDYDWKSTLNELPKSFNLETITKDLQTREQLLQTQLGGISIVKGKRIDATPDPVVLGDGLPPTGHFNVEALFLQWTYHFFILEGICQQLWHTPIGEWGPAMVVYIERELQFLVYTAAVMCLLEEGTIKGAPTTEGYASLAPMVEARITKITETLLSKTHDYGESYRRHGLQGTIPRLWDKIARYAQLSALGREANYEPKADAVKDLLGYSVIAWSLVRELPMFDPLYVSPSVTININGTNIPLLRDVISYEELREHVYGKDSKCTPTVIYHKKSGSGSMIRGQRVRIEEGMRFNVIVTGCA